MSQLFYYSIIKLVPHPIRQEAINLGVVVVSADAAYSDAKFVGKYKHRLRALAPDVNPVLIARFVEDFRARFSLEGITQSLPLPKKPPALTLETLKQWSQNEAGQIAITPPRPVMFERPDLGLRDLFEEFIAPARFVSAGPLLDRAAVRHHLVAALRQLVAPEMIIKKPSLTTRHGPNTLDLGVRRFDSTNGHLSVAMEPISFAVPSADDILRHRDHLAWVAHDVLRDNGGPVICAVVTEPAPAHRSLFEESAAIFSDVGVRTLRLPDIEQLRTVVVGAH